MLAQAIPDPPVVEHLLLENPWPIFIVMVGIAAVLRVVAQRQGRPKLNRAALAAIVIAVATFLLAHFVQTTREEVATATRALLDATIDKELAVLDRLVDPRATLVDEQGNVKLSVGEVRPELDRVLERFNLASQSIKDIAIAPREDDAAVAYLDLRTGFVDNQLPPSHTVWLMTWRRGEDGTWRLTEARWLEWMGRSPPWFGWR